MTKRFGFTLAEVLITLGIIGVVAAMTIPTLIANTNGAKFRSQFKKTISTLNQAGLMGLAQYDFDYAGTDAVCTAAAADSTQGAGASDNPNSTLSFCALLNGTLTGQTVYKDAASINSKDAGGYKWVKNYTIPAAAAAIAGETVTSISENTAPTNYILYGLADGSLVGFNKDAKNCTLAPGTPLTNAALKAGLKNCYGFIDVNGSTLPNKEVSCDTPANTKANPDTTCTVPNDAAHMTDIFPVVFHDATVEPMTNAGKFVLTTSK